MNDVNPYTIIYDRIETYPVRNLLDTYNSTNSQLHKAALKSSLKHLYITNLVNDNLKLEVILVIGE